MTTSSTAIGIASCSEGSESPQRKGGIPFEASLLHEATKKHEGHETFNGFVILVSFVRKECRDWLLFLRDAGGF
jgi:hypothetical protein